MDIQISTGAKRFLELKKLWNSGPDLFSGYYTDGRDDLLVEEWTDWFRADALGSDFTPEGFTDWSAIGLAAIPVHTTNLLACHKSHAAHLKKNLLPRCIKAVHSADLTKEDEVKRCINFLRYARHTNESPYFLKVEGIFKADPNSDEVSRYYIVTEPPCMSLGKLNSRIIQAKHVIIPPIMDEIVRELLSAVNFLHERNIKHNAISNDTIVCKSPTSIVPVALVDLNYCGENYLDENTEWHPDCPEEYQKPRKNWVHYKYAEKDGRFTNLNGCHMIAPEVVRNRRRITSRGGQSDFEEVGSAVDIYNLGAVVFELIINRSVIYLLNNKCERHTGEAGSLGFIEGIEHKYTLTRSYDLENCQECQNSYLENVEIFYDRRHAGRNRKYLGLRKLDSYTTWPYYGRKYLRFINYTLSYKPKERYTSYDLLMMWERGHRGPGADTIKQACAKQSECVIKVLGCLNRCVIWNDRNLLRRRTQHAEKLGESLITNDLIRPCYENGSSDWLSQALGEQMVTHLYNQIAVDDDLSDLHKPMLSKMLPGEPICMNYDL